MKRTPLKRKTELRAKSPLKRRADPNAQSNAQNTQKGRRKVQKAAQKDCRWRSPDYLAWVRSLPCSACSIQGCDAHHVIGLGWGLSGMGLTAPDSYVMPLCRACHGEMHREPGWQQYQPKWIKQTIRAAFVAGVSAEAREELSHALAFVEAKEAQP